MIVNDLHAKSIALVEAETTAQIIPGQARFGMRTGNEDEGVVADRDALGALP